MANTVQTALLLVDDDHAFRHVMHEVLKSQGYLIYEAENGRQALEQLQNYPTISGLLTDIFMGGMDGLELIRNIRKKYPKLYIIALSAGSHSPMGDFLKAAQSFGAHHVFPKPVDFDALLDVLSPLQETQSVS